MEKRVGTPTEAADLILFLASDRAIYINGVCLSMDGSLYARTGEGQQDRQINNHSVLSSDQNYKVTPKYL